MKRQRTQAIIIQENRVLFGKGVFDDREKRHYFIGGGVEEGELPANTILRELREEANVNGEIIFKMNGIAVDGHHTYLVDIGCQTPVLGFDPEEEEIVKSGQQKMLQNLEFIPLNKAEMFTAVDIIYFKMLIKECANRKYMPDWIIIMEETVKKSKFKRE